MKENQVNIESSYIFISAKRAPVLIRLFLSLILLILFLIPLAVTIFAMTYGNGPHVGIMFSYILCWGVGFYLLRTVLWNWVGREILILNQRNITYIADYRLFKDGRKEIGTGDLRIEAIYEDEPNKPLGRLRLSNKSSSIETVLQTTLFELEEILHEIKTRYNSQ